MDARMIGRRIQDARIAVGLTQAELAQKVDLTPKYISNIECGDKTPKLETLVALANALGTDANTLLADVLDVSAQIITTQLSNRLERLPASEQSRLLRIFETIITDALEQL